MAKLTPKQERFVAEYLIDLNATDAARRAGYSAKTAEQQGYRLLRNVQIAAAIAAAKKTTARKLAVSAEWVIKNLRSNHAKALALDKIGDSNRALELIGKHLAMFTEKVAHAGHDGGPLPESKAANVLDRIAGYAAALLALDDGPPNGDAPGDGSGKHLDTAGTNGTANPVPRSG